MSESTDIQKWALETLVEGISNKIERAAEKNDGKVPYGMLAKELAQAKLICPSVTITRDHVNNMLRKRKKTRLANLATARTSSASHIPNIVTTTSVSTPAAAAGSTSTDVNYLASATVTPTVNTITANSTSANRKRPRPKGVKDKVEQLHPWLGRYEKMKIDEAKNEICEIYYNELQAHKQKHEGQNFPTGRLDQIISDVKKKRKIEDDVPITKKYVRRRIYINNGHTLKRSKFKV